MTRGEMMTRGGLTMTDVWKKSGEMKTINTSYENISPSSKTATLNDGSRIALRKTKHTGTASKSCTAHAHPSWRVTNQKIEIAPPMREVRARSIG